MKIHNSTKGYVLVSVLVIMAILLVITYYLADILYSEYSIASNQRASSKALNLSEAGAQNAIWVLQNDATAKNTFLTTTNGQTTIGPKTLFTGGTFTAVIKNTALGAATITSTGYDSFSAKQAQRVIKLNVMQAGNPVEYPYEAGLLVGGPSSGNIDLHNMTFNASGSSEPFSIACGGTINIGNASVNVPIDILANSTIGIQNSNVTQGGVQQQNYSTIFALPGVDINSDSPASYKSQAIAQGQYYTSAQFSTLLKTRTIFNGIVYVAGSGGVTIKNKNVTVNGALVSEGSILINNANVNVYHNPAPSGILTMATLTINNANVNVEGLVYVGVLAAGANNANITVTGAILAHDFSANNITLTLNFNRSYVNESLSGGGNATTPVIQFQHWEEEY